MVVEVDGIAEGVVKFSQRFDWRWLRIEGGEEISKRLAEEPRLKLQENIAEDILASEPRRSKDIISHAHISYLQQLHLGL